MSSFTNATNATNENNEHDPDLNLVISAHTDFPAPTSGRRIWDLAISADYKNGHITSSAIVILFDISGSMGEEAVPAVTTSETVKYNNLDIARYCVQCIAESSDYDVAISLVTFNHRASIEMGLTSMDTEGKRTIQRKLGYLEHGGSTNIWDALSKGMEIINKSSKSENNHIVLMTDGVPNINPPEGIMTALNRFKDLNGGKLSAPISTLGFGYGIESNLLKDIANLSGGTYNFIPDSTFCGTAVINMFANIRCSQIKDVDIQYTLNSGVNIISEIPNPAQNRLPFPITIQNGQRLTTVISVIAPHDLDPSELITARATYTVVGFQEIKTSIATFQSNPDCHSDLIIARARTTFVTSIKKVYNLLLTNNYSSKILEVKDIVSKLQTFLIESIASAYVLPEKRVILEDLLKDVEGEVQQAIKTSEQYSRWGRHYLPSLVRAHELQQCNNFKDHGVQHYGGSMFKSIRDTAEDIFISLPQPKSSVHVSTPAPAPVIQVRQQPTPSSYGSSSATSATTATNYDMSNYYSRSTGCIGANSKVPLMNGSTKLASELKKGDVLLNGAIISCIWETVLLDGIGYLCKLPSGLVISPYHPVKHNDIWVFPNDISDCSYIECTSVYSFLFEDKNNSFFADGVEVIALCHGIQDDLVASHEFFGTNEVVDNLRELDFEGFEAGLVTIYQQKDRDIFLRDPITKRVIRIVA